MLPTKMAEAASTSGGRGGTEGGEAGKEDPQLRGAKTAKKIKLRDEDGRRQRSSVTRGPRAMLVVNLGV